MVIILLRNLSNTLLRHAEIYALASCLAQRLYEVITCKEREKQ